MAAILGVQSARAATQPRPFLKLAKQHLAVQVTPQETPTAYMIDTDSPGDALRLHAAGICVLQFLHVMH